MGKSRNLWIIIRWWGCVFSYVCICKAGEEEDTTALCLRCLQGLEEKHRSSISSRPLRLEESSGTARKSHTESHLCSYVASCISLLVANPTYVHTPAVYNDLEPPPHHNHPHLCTSVACCLCRLFGSPILPPLSLQILQAPALTSPCSSSSRGPAGDTYYRGGTHKWADISNSDFAAPTYIKKWSDTTTAAAAAAEITTATTTATTTVHCRCRTASTCTCA